MNEVDKLKNEKTFKNVQNGVAEFGENKNTIGSRKTITGYQNNKLGVHFFVRLPSHSMT